MLVEDSKALQKYYDKLQSRIDAAELLGFDTTEYENASYGTFHFRKGIQINGDEKLIIKPPRSKTDNSNFIFTLDCDLVESNEE
jgi:hypothetical protein